MKDPIQDTIQRTQRYWFSDGANEIGMGILFTLLALSLFVMERVNSSGYLGLIIGILQPVIFLAGFWLINHLVQKFKEKITYPRTGYILYPRRNGKRRLTAAFISGGTAAILAIGASIISDRLGGEIMPVISGIIIAAAIVYLGIRFGLNRFYLLAVYIFICGALITLSDIQGINSIALFFGLMGMGWVFSGIWTLIHYLRTTHPLDEEEHE
jgi:hypothetical protein